MTGRYDRRETLPSGERSSKLAVGSERGLEQRHWHMMLVVAYLYALALWPAMDATRHGEADNQLKCKLRSVKQYPAMDTI